MSSASVAGVAGAPGLAQSRSRLDRFAARVWNVVRQEIAPYPGRGAIVARMVLSSVLIMLLVMTFRIPGAALAGYYTLLLSRESPRATLAGAVELVLAFGAGVVYVLLSAMFVFGSPVLHLLWVVFTLFLIFFVMRVLRSYSAAAGFGFLIVTCIPVWDRTIPPEDAVEATLWIAGAVTMGAVVTVAVEYLSAPFQRLSPIESGLAERWEAIEGALLDCGAGRHSRSIRVLDQFATVGVSRLRRAMLRSGGNIESVEQTGVIVAVTERLVDLTAALVHIEASHAEAECRSLHALGERMRHLRLGFLGNEAAPPVTHAAQDDTRDGQLPILPEIARDVALLEAALQGRVPSPDQPVQHAAVHSLFRSDAFENPDHIRFALQGCLAASACYITYNAIGWPGLNTSVATCIMTALSSVGSSRQKQLLRVVGAAVGGFVFAMGGQMFVLPGMDSITAFTVFFAAVIGIAAWLSTSSARMSYFGLQIALAFLLVHLQEPRFQVSLSSSRDRVLGILLGLFFMWIAFDLFTGVPAAGEMLRHFRRALSRMAELQQLSLATDSRVIAATADMLRDDLISTFAAMNTEADAVLFETGPQRDRDLALRERILSAQPNLRALLLLQTTTLRYRRTRLLHDLPPRVAEAQRAFDESVRETLQHLAKHSVSLPALPPEQALAELERRIQERYAGGPISTEAEAVLALSASIVGSLNVLEPLERVPLPAS